MAVGRDTGRSSTHNETFTGADCSPVTIRRSPSAREGLQQQNMSSEVSFNPTTLAVWTLQGRTKHGTITVRRKPAERRPLSSTDGSSKHFCAIKEVNQVIPLENRDVILTEEQETWSRPWFWRAAICFDRSG